MWCPTYYVKVKDLSIEELMTKKNEIWKRIKKTEKEYLSSRENNIVVLPDGEKYAYQYDLSVLKDILEELLNKI